MNYLGELFEQRVGRHLVACRVIRDVRFDSPGDDEHHLNVLVEIAAFHGKGIGHQVERTLRRGVNPVPWDHAVRSVIGQLISVMGGGTHTLPATDPTFTMIPLPCAAICGMTSCVSLIGAKKFVSNALRAVSRSTSKAGPMKNQSTSLLVIASRFTRTHHTSVVDQYVYTTGFSEHFVDDALPTLFVSDIQKDLSEAQ